MRECHLTRKEAILCIHPCLDGEAGRAWLVAPRAARRDCILRYPARLHDLRVVRGARDRGETRPARVQTDARSPEKRQSLRRRLPQDRPRRSEENTTETQALMRKS